MNGETVQHALLLLILWMVYFGLHSWTASLGFKKIVFLRWPAFKDWYRLTYNMFSTLTLLPPLVLMIVWKTEPVIDWSGLTTWVLNAIALAALVLFYLSTRYYDMKEFLGTCVLVKSSGIHHEHQTFCLSPFHRFVRHPWYFFGLLLIWTRNMDLMQLVSSLAMTLYLVVGSYLEERKLVLEYGEMYRRYQQKVPGLIPLPWKYLKHEENP